MYEAVKVALDPTPAQERRLLSHAGAARFAYNAALAHVKEAIEVGERPEWSFFSLINWWNANKDELTIDDDGLTWWRENSREAYNSGLESLAKGLSNWAKSRKGTRKGGKIGFPKFKSKGKTSPRFAYASGCFGLIDGDPKALKFPRIGRVHCMEDVSARVGDGRVKRMTISQRAGRWFASLTVEREDESITHAPKGDSVGVDLGIKTLATISDGTVFENPRHLKKSERKLKRVQRALSRKTKGSNRRARAKAKVARIHAHVTNQRQDTLHKLTTHLASQYSSISIEDLNVAGMMKSHTLAKSVMDASFGEFRRQLEYKTARTGAKLNIVDRWYPSSKTCSRCGRVKAKLSLSERTYSCDSCGLVIDRDLNAAININVAGGAPETVNAHGGTGSRDDLSGHATQDPLKCEPSCGDDRVRLGAGGRKTPYKQTKTKLFVTD